MDDATGDLRQQRWFCSSCSTTLYWLVAAYPGHTGIAGGRFAGHPCQRWRAA
jgi:hypothetical protein